MGETKDPGGLEEGGTAENGLDEQAPKVTMLITIFFVDVFS